MKRDVPDDPPDGGSSSFPEVRPHLERARELGFFGPGPIDAHVRHALGFAEAVGAPPGLMLDLGTGGGLPGLVLLAHWPETEGILLDSNERRTAFLADAVAALGWDARVRVVRIRAEEAGRAADLRGRVPLVVSRGFGSPPVVAECAAPLLSVGGRLVVSEPPDAGERWPAAGLRVVGMVPERAVRTRGGSFQVLCQEMECPEAYPRRSGLPAKRPLW